MPTSHARLSCSGAHRWMACPGSVALEAMLPPAPSGEAAIEGTTAHDLHELSLLLGLPAADCVALLPTATEEMAEAVQISLDWIAQELAKRPGARLLTEQRLRPGLAIDRSDIWGTADALVVDRAEIMVIDYKHGVGLPVEVEGNPQLLLYGLGALVATQTEPHQLTLVVVQPRAPHRAGPVRSTVVTPSALLEFAEQARVAALRTEEDGAALIPGEHCRFCAAAGACPALAEHALRLAQIEFASPVVPASSDRIGELLHEAALVKLWAKALEEHALRLAESGVDLSGWRLVQRRGHRAWINPATTIEWLTDKGLDLDAVAPRVLTSPRQVEMAAKRARIKLDLAPQVTRPEIGHRLVADTAPGDDFVDAETEFAGLEWNDPLQDGTGVG